MPRVLLVKTSSLGDVVHNLPAASDLAAQLPGVHIDWVVEEGYAAVPALHPAVASVIPVAVRRWRSAPLHPATWREARAFAERLRAVRYDAVIDTQGLLKSALLARLARGVRYGLDWQSSREPLSVFYDSALRIPRTQHAVVRNRSLVAQALDYTPPARVDYGIRAARTSGTESYAVLLHATSAPSKLWPEARWIALGRALAGEGLTSVLPWGGEDEKRRAERIAAGIPGAEVPARMPLELAAERLAGARGVIGLDTGLTHLAGALGARTVGIYTATDPAATGLYGCAHAVNVGGPAAMPEVDEVLRALEALPS